jgi:hypothetical protein
MRYQQGNYGLAEDLRDSRKRGMELRREIDQLKLELERWKKIAADLHAANYEQDGQQMDRAIARYEEAI